MDSIVIMYQPFVVEQLVIVYNNGVVVETHRININEIADLIEKLTIQYSNVNSISLIGNQDYLIRYQKDLGLRVPDNVKINIVNN